MDIEKYVKMILEAVYKLHEFITGSTSNGDVILDATLAAKTFRGKAKYIVLLADSEFTAYSVDDRDVLEMRGYSGTTIPSKTLINPGKDKYITDFTIDVGSMVQVWQ